MHEANPGSLNYQVVIDVKGVTLEQWLVERQRLWKLNLQIEGGNSCRIVGGA